jgi:hypothetical protein
MTYFLVLYTLSLFKIKLFMRNSIYLSVMFLFSFQNFYSQGCSDAGFCSLDHKTEESVTKNAINFGVGIGSGFENVSIFNSSIEYGRSITKGFSIQTKLTYQSTSGDLGSNSGLGDVFFIGNFIIPSKNENQNWGISTGFKFPLSDANAKANNGFSLPLDYQTSIATTDFIAGVNVVFDKKWEFQTAVQIPIANQNKNQFVQNSYPNTAAFVTTNDFVRKPDALFRAGYNYNLKETKFSFKPNLLFIYHLGEDQFTLANVEQNIKGSDGLTLNGVLNTTYSLNSTNKLELVLASPFVVRDVRPDGLTRLFVASLQYKYSF